MTENIVANGGIIQVSLPLMNGWDISVSHCDTQGALKEQGVFEQLHKHLLLPESYTVRGVFYRWLSRYWDVWVESTEIPETEEYDALPSVTPSYHRDEDGTVRLVGIRIERVSTFNVLSHL